MHISGLRNRMTREIALNYQGVLINAIDAFDDETPIAEILQFEILQTTGGYAPAQANLNTGGEPTYNAVTNTLSSQPVSAQFTEPLNGAGYDYTHVLLIQGRSGRANKQVTSVNATTDQITVAAHGLTTGDRCFIRSTGAVPTGLTVTAYYASVIGPDVIELFTDSALSAKATFSDQGTGTLYLQYCNGVIYDVLSIPGRINPGATKAFNLSLNIY